MTALAVDVSSEDANAIEYVTVGGTARVPVVCDCGCGERINDDVIEILTARQMGASYLEIGRRVGKTAAAIKQRIRSMPKRKRGHMPIAGRTWVDFDCRICGKTVHRPSTTRYPHCAGLCGEGDATHEGLEERWRLIYIEPQAIHRENAEAAGALTAEHRRLIKLAKERAILTGSKQHWEREMLAASPEAREILAEQLRDDVRYQIQFAPSIDNDFYEGDDGSRSAAALGAIHFDREDDRWPYYAGQGRHSRLRAG